MRDGEDLCPVYQCVRALRIAGCDECGKARCRLGNRAALECQLRVQFGGERPSQTFLRTLERARGAVSGSAGRASGRSANRLRSYLRTIAEYERRDVPVVSSHQLARGVGIRASLVRRDLAELGGLGTPGKGYEVGPLGAAIREALDLGRKRPAIWLGLGGPVDWRCVVEALRAVNCLLVGVFDDNAAQGRAIDKLMIQPLSRAPAEARRTAATVAVVASERAAGRELLESLVDAGVQGILNLTPLRLELPARVVVEQCDLGSEMVRLVSRLGSD